MPRLTAGLLTIAFLVTAAAAWPAGASAAKLLKLGKVGVKAGSATASGQTLKVTLRLKQRTRVRLEVVQGKRVVARAKAKTLKKGRRRVTAKLDRRPTGSSLRVRITAKNLVTRKSGRGFTRLVFVGDPVGDPAPDPTPPLGTGVNRAPTDITVAGATVAENQPAGTAAGTLKAVDANATDVHKLTLVSGTGDADNALFTLEGTQLRTAAPLDFEAQAARSVRVRADDGKGGVFEKAIAVAVTDVNEAPTAPKLSASSVSESAAPGTAVGVLTATDPDAGQQVTFSLVSGAGDADNAAFAIDGTALETVTPLDFETKPSYTVRIQADDGQGGVIADQFSIVVTDETEGPTATMSATPLQYTENGAAVAVDPGTTVTAPGELSGATVRMSAGQETGDVLAFTNQNGITGSYHSASGVLTLSGAASPAAYQQALRTVTYRSTSENPATSKAIEIVLHAGPSSGAPATRALTVAAVNDPPVADADAYGGGQRGVRMRVGSEHADAHEVEVAGKVLEGDTDVDTPAGSLTVTPGAIATADGGTVTMAADGSFTYDPPAGDDGTDTFTYTVEDNDTGDSDASEDTHTATVTITQAGPRVWFVDDSAPAGGRGVSHAPLQSLSVLATGGAQDAKDGTGDRIFVYSGAYVGGIELETGQWLHGEPQGLNLAGRQLVAAGGTKPAIAGSTGHAVTLQNGGQDVRQLSLGNTPANAYSLHAPAGAGVFTVADTDIANATGGALQILDGTPAVTLGTLSSSGSAGHVVRITETEGGTVSSSTGLLQSSSLATFSMTNANTAVTLGSAISDDAGRLVEVTGGTSDVTYNGTITDGEDGDGDGIAITGTSGDHNFTKSVLLSTGNANAMSMTNSASGSLRMVPTTGTNRATTTGGAALTVTDTPIAAGGLAFERITSADPAIEAGTYGINLSNTGTTAGLTVAGTGVADSGGVILGKATGIRINNGRGPSLSWMKLSNHGDFAIKGDTVTGFALTSSVIDGSVGRNGDAPNANEGAVSFDELFGTNVAITNSVIKEGVSNDLRVRNDSGTLNRLTVTGSTFGSTQATHNDSIQLDSLGSGSLNATVQNNVFTSARGDHFQSATQGTSAGDIVFSGNTVSNSHPTSLGGQIVVSASGSGDLTYNISGNTINGALATAIAVEATFTGAGRDSTAVGTISGNTIGTSNVAGSGSSAASGILVGIIADGRHSSQILNNTIRQMSQRGIIAFAGGASRTTTGGLNNGDLNLTIAGNLVEQPYNMGSSSSGLYLEAGTNSDGGPDRYDVCVGLNNNNMSAAGEDQSSTARDYVIAQAFETIVRMPGWGGPVTSQDGTFAGLFQSYIDARDTGAASLTTLGRTAPTDYDATIADGFYNTAGAAACPTS